MSSPDHGRRSLATIRTFAVACVATLALSACTVQPLYGPAPSGQAVSATLSNIDIAQVGTRVGQEVRNRLLFGLSGGAAVPAAYRMSLIVTAAESALGVTPIETAPVYAITVSATYEIRSIATGDIVLRGTSRGTASFDRTTQLYANARARLDAEDRAAQLAADDIRMRLASAAAKGTI